MMAEPRASDLVCDEKGRVVLPKPMRERHGVRFLAVDTPEGIWLIPRSGDPVRRLTELGKDLPDIPISELRRQAREDLEAIALRKADRVRRR
jgi:bifunctional DNA-binding transcriptional regulator/antitoxin component of YhaV-PrlF toxin-antitoxin module